MGESKTSSQTLVFFDDRQRVLEFAPEFVIADHSGVRPALLPRIILWSGLGLGVGVVILGLVGHLQTLTVRDLLPCLIGIAIGPIVRPVTTWIMKRQKPVLPAYAALLAAHRHCGACGYDLHQIPVESDGCAVCPECGAAWHQDRFVRADEDPKESEQLSSLMSGDIAIGTGERQDDRGQPLRAALKWPPEWLHYASTPLSATEELENVARSKLRWLLKWLVPSALVFWLGLTALLVARAYQPDIETGVFTGSVTLLITGIAVYAGVRIYIDRAMRRAGVDVLGLCNQCGKALPMDDPPTFDGCVVCSGCKSAWKRIAAVPAQRVVVTCPGAK